MVFVTKHRVRMVVPAMLLSVGLASCSSGSDVAQVTTVTVTAPAPAKPQPTPTRSIPSPTPTPAEEQFVYEGRHPPFGIMLEYARQLCLPPVTALPDLVTRGDSPEFTEVLQTFALTFGYETGAYGEYDAQTIRAVRQIQSDLGVVPDGQVGPITWSALRNWQCPYYEPYFAEDYNSEASTDNSTDYPDEPTAYPAPSPTGDSDPVPVALPKIGTCPFGYISNFDTCDPGPGARYAIVKTGAMCPVGYRPDWQYCVLQ